MLLLYIRSIPFISFNLQKELNFLSSFCCFKAPVLKTQPQQQLRLCSNDVFYNRRDDSHCGYHRDALHRGYRRDVHHDCRHDPHRGDRRDRHRDPRHDDIFMT